MIIIGFVPMLIPCGSVGRQPEQWGEFRVAQREFQQHVWQCEREHRVSAKLVNENLTFGTKPCPLAKQNNEHTELVTSVKARYQFKLSMKRKAHLFDQIASKENIERAFVNARKGKNHYREVRVIE